MNKYLPWVIGLLGISAMLFFNSCQATRNAEWKHKADSLAALAKGTDTVYVHDTLTLTKWQTKVKIQRESLIVTDTVKVKEFIAVQDSTIHACTQALNTCEKRVADRDAIIANLKKKPGAPRFGSIVVGPALIVTPNGNPTVGLGVTFGIRLR
jgi:hypothetical protein